MYLNGELVTGLRDSGNFAHTLVDKNCVNPQQYNGRAVKLRDAFDKTYIERPLANVWLRSPHFGYNKDILVEVAVTELSVVGCSALSAIRFSTDIRY